MSDNDLVPSLPYEWGISFTKNECIRMVVKAQDHWPTWHSRQRQKDVNILQHVLGDCRGDDTKLAEGVAPELGSKMVKFVETLWQASPTRGERG